MINKMRMKEINLNELAGVSGGQYDPDVTYIDTQVIKSGNLYNVSNIRETAGQIQFGQAIQRHPDYSYYMNGVELCLVRIGTKDYVTERANIA
jgi:hypothetical protein